MAGWEDKARLTCYSAIISICKYMYIYIYIHRVLHIYIYREREIERERETYIYIYIYICIACNMLHIILYVCIYIIEREKDTTAPNICQAEVVPLVRARPRTV